MRCIRVSPNGQLLASGDRQGNIRSVLKSIKFLLKGNFSIYSIEKPMHYHPKLIKKPNFNASKLGLFTVYWYTVRAHDVSLC